MRFCLKTTMFIKIIANKISFTKIFGIHNLDENYIF